MAPRAAPAESSTARQRAKPVKRRADDVESEDEGLMRGELEMSDDEEGSEDEEDEDEEFPELDSGSDGDTEELEDSEEEDEDDEGYNSSDIDAMTDDLVTPGSSSTNLDEKLSKLIAINSSKPNDAIGSDGKISLSKDGKGRLVKSKYVDGSYIREYDEYEAGYGSESSTEEVSLRWIELIEPQHYRQRAHRMV
jgi:ribosome biogenesis protein ERB1